MREEICNKVDYLSEAVALLGHLASNKSYIELKNSLSVNRNVIFTSKNDTFNKLTKIEKSAQKAFAGEMEEIRYYFLVEEKAERSCGNAILLWDGFSNLPYLTADEWDSHIRELPEEDYIKAFGNQLQGYTNNMGDESSYETLSEAIEIITYLMNMDISREEKWKLQTIFLNRQEHYPKIMDLVRKMIGFLQGCQNELEAMAEEFFEYWSRELAGQTLREYLKKRIDINLPDNPYGYRLRPGLLIPNVMGIHIDTDDEGNYKKQDECWIGILYGDEMDISSDGEKDEVPDMQYILRILKLLSDKSKFEILSRISDDSAYGSQLAKEMNLTAATISHHVNSMMTEGILTVEVRENRVYYQLDKKKLKKVLNACSELLKL